MQHYEYDLGTCYSLTFLARETRGISSYCLRRWLSPLSSGPASPCAKDIEASIFIDIDICPFTPARMPHLRLLPPGRFPRIATHFRQCLPSFAIIGFHDFRDFIYFMVDFIHTLASPTAICFLFFHAVCWQCLSLIDIVTAKKIQEYTSASMPFMIRHDDHFLAWLADAMPVNAIITLHWARGPPPPITRTKTLLNMLAPPYKTR